MPAFSLDDLTFVLLRPGVRLDSFDCGDKDLNAFISRDAFRYSEQELAKTYVALHSGELVAFVSICADAIRLSQEEQETEFGKEKHHADYPAIKIARLAVANRHHGQGIGTAMVEYAIGKALEVSENIGCRFVTIDAYPGKQDFYEKCGFDRNEKDTSGDQISMRFDVLAFKRVNTPGKRGLPSK